MIEEFKKFIMRGNVIDLAVAVIIGAAFNDIVNSLVKEVLTPPLSLITGKIDFKNLVIPLVTTVDTNGNTTIVSSIGIGSFLNATINFVIIAVVVFFLVKAVNKMMAFRAKETEVTEPPEPTAQEKLLTEIRDLLKEQRA